MANGRIRQSREAIAKRRPVAAPHSILELMRLEELGRLLLLVVTVAAAGIPMGACSSAKVLSSGATRWLLVAGVRNRTHRRSRWGAAVLAVAIALLRAAAAGAEGEAVSSWWSGELGVSAGLEFSSGDYGESERTDIIYVPFSVRYLLDRFPVTRYEGDWVELGVTVSYVWARGPGYPFAASESFDASGGEPGTDVGTGQGLGDIITRLTYLVAPPAGGWLPFGEVSATLKIPTADEDENLGTGEVDVTLEVALSRRFEDFTPFVTVGYRWMGDSPSYDVRDRWLASSGVVYRASGGFRAGLTYAWREAISSRVEDAHEFLPFISFRLGPRFWLQPYGVIGISNGSPDLGAGLQIRASILVRQRESLP